MRAMLAGAKVKSNFENEKVCCVHHLNRGTPSSSVLRVKIGYLSQSVPINLVMMNGSQLLADYRDNGSESAFAELVRQHTNLVYSTAKRRLQSDSLAEDVTQSVFARLARMLPRIATDAELIGWLHRTTLHVAIDVWRSETRRHAREQEAFAMESPSNVNSTPWEQVAPRAG
jgi:hypothetical protein